MTTSKFIYICTFWLLTQTIGLAQNIKQYPLIGNWEAIPQTIEPDSSRAAYPVQSFTVKLILQKNTVPVSFGSIAEGGVKVDYDPYDYNTVLKKTDIKNKRQVVFKGLFPFCGKKGKVRIKLVHPDTLLWETLWLPSTANESYIPKRAKLLRVEYHSEPKKKL